MLPKNYMVRLLGELKKISEILLLETVRHNAHIQKIENDIFGPKLSKIFQKKTFEGFLVKCYV